jgi:hypothetical protein
VPPPGTSAVFFSAADVVVVVVNVDGDGDVNLVEWA